MKIVVCVKHVPDATGNRSFNDDGTVDRAAVDGLLSELDEYAVEAALQLREAGAADGEITALTIGPGPARAAIQKSLQMGADAGIHVVDDAIHGSDALSTSLVLAKAIERTGADLVVCGMSSTDGGMGVVPAMLAERLGFAQLTLASEVSLEGSTLRIRRDGDVATETVEAELPGVLSVTDQANEPRYPSFKGIMGAKKKPVEELSLADLGIEHDDVGLSAAWTVVDSAIRRPPRGAGTIVTDDGTGAQRLVEFLAAGKFV